MGEKATVLKPFGDIFLNLMFTAIVPLVFATIASAIGNMLNMKRLGKILGSLLAVFVVTGLIAGVIIIFIVTVYPPAAGVHITMEAAGEMEAVKLSDAIVNALTVSDFSALLSRQNMLPLIIFSIMFGFCISACGGKESAVGQVVNNLADIMMKIVNIIMMYAPLDWARILQTWLGNSGQTCWVLTEGQCWYIIRYVRLTLSYSFHCTPTGQPERTALEGCGNLYFLLRQPPLPPRVRLRHCR